MRFIDSGQFIALHWKKIAHWARPNQPRPTHYLPPEGAEKGHHMATQTQIRTAVIFVLSGADETERRENRKNTPLGMCPQFASNFFEFLHIFDYNFSRLKVKLDYLVSFDSTRFPLSNDIKTSVVSLDLTKL